MRRKFKLDKSIKYLSYMRKEIKKCYNDLLQGIRPKNKKLPFTLDGVFVGNIGEAVAAQHFGMLYDPQPGIDGWACNKKGEKISVQVKATGKKNSGPAYGTDKSRADHLLFFIIDYDEPSAELIYDGPEQKVFDKFGKAGRSLRPSLQNMIDLNKEIDNKDRLGGS